MLPRIKEIIGVHPYIIKSMWTDGKIRDTDLNSLINKEGSVFNQLKNESLFLKAKLDREARTVYWENLLKMVDLDGKEIDVPLDVCPDVLLSLSKEVD